MDKKVVILTAMDPLRDIRANKIAKSLSDEGYMVVIIGGYSEIIRVKEKGYSIYSFSLPYKTDAGIFTKLLWKIKYFRFSLKLIKENKPDIIHAANIDMLMLTSIYGFKKSKIVYDSYEICAHKSGVASKSRFLSAVIELIEKRLIKSIDYMICVSNAAEKYFVTKFRVKNIKVITNVPSQRIILDENNKDFMNVLYIGNYSHSRGIEEYILSGKYIQDDGVKLLLQGFGPCEDKFKNLVSDNNLTDRVIFKEPVEPDLVLEEIYRSANIGIVLTKPTSLNHKLTVSNKIFDYINAGLPVIMSNVEEHVYLNDIYNFGIIIDKIEPDEIAKAITKLATNTELYNMYSRNCRVASEKLNWDQEKSKLYELYNEMQSS